MGVLITRPNAKKWYVVDNNHDLQYWGVGGGGGYQQVVRPCFVAVGVHVKSLLFCLLLFQNCLLGKMCVFSNSVYSFPVLCTFVTS